MRLFGVLLISLFLVGCTTSKAVYIVGEDGANATIEFSMTGGRMMLNGPFKYCSEPAVMQTNGEVAITDSVCVVVMEKE